MHFIFTKISFTNLMNLLGETPIYPNLLVYILSPPPNPYVHYVSNAVVAAFSHQLQHIVKSTNLIFYDFFSPFYPCVNDKTEVPGNTNHYFQGGKGMGEQIWFHLLMDICTNASNKTCGNV